MWQAPFGLAMREAWRSGRANHRHRLRGTVRPIWRPSSVWCWHAAAVLLSPASTNRTMASRPFGVRGAFLWLFIWSLRETLKLRNLSFLGSDQMDNLLKAHS